VSSRVFSLSRSDRAFGTCPFGVLLPVICSPSPSPVPVPFSLGCGLGWGLHWTVWLVGWFVRSFRPLSRRHVCVSHSAGKSLPLLVPFLRFRCRFRCTELYHPSARHFFSVSVRVRVARRVLYPLSVFHFLYLSHCPILLFRRLNTFCFASRLARPSAACLLACLSAGPCPVSVSCALPSRRWLVPVRVLIDRRAKQQHNNKYTRVVSCHQFVRFLLPTGPLLFGLVIGRWPCPVRAGVVLVRVRVRVRCRVCVCVASRLGSALLGCWLRGLRLLVSVSVPVPMSRSVCATPIVSYGRPSACQPTATAATVAVAVAYRHSQNKNKKTKQNPLAAHSACRSVQHLRWPPHVHCLTVALVELRGAAAAASLARCGPRSVCCVRIRWMQRLCLLCCQRSVAA